MYKTTAIDHNGEKPEVVLPVDLGPVYMEWGPLSSGVGFFCFHPLGDTKQKKLTPLDQGPPLHVNRVLVAPGHA